MYLKNIDDCIQKTSLQTRIPIKNVKEIIEKECLPVVIPWDEGNSIYALDLCFVTPGKISNVDLTKITRFLQIENNIKGSGIRKVLKKDRLEAIYNYIYNYGGNQILMSGPYYGKNKISWKDLI